MATIRSGDQAVLLVVDAQVGVIGSAWDAPRIVANLADVVTLARNRGVPVLWVQHANAELASGSAGWQLVPELQPAANEPLIGKCHNSAFEDTALDAALETAAASHIVLVGAASNWCIRATAYGALERGYDVTLVSDAHTTDPIALNDGRCIEAAQIVDELNVAMQWLSYPGRRNRVVAASALDFSAPA